MRHVGNGHIPRRESPAPITEWIGQGRLVIIELPGQHDMDRYECWGGGLTPGACIPLIGVPQKKRGGPCPCSLLPSSPCSCSE